LFPDGWNMSTDSLEIVLRAEVAASEDPKKVLLAAQNVLGSCIYRVEEGPDRIALRTNEKGCLQRVHDQLRDRHVRDAARRLLLKSLEGKRLTLLLNRQAAFAGIVAVVSSGEESPLGPLVLEVVTEDPQALVDWLTFYRPEEPRPRAHPSQQESP